MANMLRLIKLQFASLSAIKKEIGLILIMSMVIIFINPNMIAFSGAMVIMGMCYTPFMYEEKSKNSFLIHSLPIDPKEYILSKYIYSAIATILGGLLSTIEYYILLNLKLIEVEALSSILMSIFIVGVFMTAVVIPTAMILGAEKGRYVLIFLAVAPICFSQNIVEFISGVRISEMLMIILGILTAITVTLLSYFITANMYSRKEIV